LKDYQIEAMRFIWSKPQGVGASSREVWMGINQNLKTRSISRASVINFLNAMVEEGVLENNEITGKGGHRGIYSAKLDEATFKRYIAEVVLGTLKRDFPEETRKALSLL
jgi:predicted transcriptional regulator